MKRFRAFAIILLVMLLVLPGTGVLADDGQTTAGNEAAGQITTGSEAAGQVTTGSEAAGQEATDSEAAGQETAGSEAAGQATTGSESAGQITTGSEAAGQATTGSEAAGQVTTGSEAAGQTTTGSDAASANILKIQSVEDFINFVGNCTLDTYSRGLSVSLENDLDLSDTGFSGIPWFAGTFEGNGHRISGVSINRAGVNTGFFRTIGKEGVVKNLIVEGTVMAEETAENTGGIAGDNFGNIIGCSFEGDIEGLNCVGGIAGINEESGVITSCSFNGHSKGEHQIGGISGTSYGTISLCTNTGSINTEAIIVSEEKTENIAVSIISGVADISEDEVLDVTDIGGIAGYSSGTVHGCKNAATVGYKHMGYNVGGICGRSSGFVTECSSSGDVSGKNDVGGIVGQLEPYTVWDLSESNLEKLRNRFSEFENSVTALKDNISSASNEISNSVSNVISAATRTQTAFAAVVEKVSSKSNEAAEALQITIENINEKNAREQLKSLAAKLREMSPDTSELTNSVAETASAAEALRSSITADRGLYENVTSVINTLTNIVDTGLNTAGSLGLQEDYLNDISVASAYTENRGAIDKCTCNSGIHGDTGLGGIVGTMDMEISFDLENQLNLSDYLFGNARYQVFAVTRDSGFDGSIDVKKANAGGICGNENFGLLINSTAQGTIVSEGANFVGGIAGLSSSSIISCYSRMNLSGDSYVGGIAGNGNNISGCIAYSYINTGKELLGGICGAADGTVENCFYVAGSAATVDEGTGAYGGIDGVDYEGRARAVSYDEMCKMENVPDSFKKIEVTFVKDGEIVKTYEVPYGGSISETPEIPPEDGKFWKWDDFCKENITNSFTVNGSFEEPVKTISTDEEMPRFLAEGNFSEAQRLVVEEPEENVFKLSITDFEGSALIRMKGTNLQVNEKTDNNETKAIETTEDGSYTVFTVNLPCTIAVSEKQETNTWITYLVIAGAVAAVVVIILIIIKKKKKNKNPHLPEATDEEALEEEVINEKIPSEETAGGKPQDAEMPDRKEADEKLSDGEVLEEEVINKKIPSEETAGGKPQDAEIPDRKEADEKLYEGEVLEEKVINRRTADEEATGNLRKNEQSGKKKPHGLKRKNGEDKCGMKEPKGGDYEI